MFGELILLGIAVGAGRIWGAVSNAKKKNSVATY